MKYPHYLRIQQQLQIMKVMFFKLLIYMIVFLLVVTWSDSDTGNTPEKHLQNFEKPMFSYATPSSNVLKTHPESMLLLYIKTILGSSRDAPTKLLLSNVSSTKRKKPGNDANYTKEVADLRSLVHGEILGI
jgi:hypothetical protein